MNNNLPDTGILGRIFGFFFGLAFAGFGASFIGIAFTQMGGAPFFFRIPFVLVPLVFVVIGCSLMYAVIMNKNPMQSRVNHLVSQMKEQQAQKKSNQYDSINLYAYECNNCGATLGDDADVSPQGDVKCAYCRQWFNINESKP